MRHTAMVPKGFIRYHVLESLSEKPMSGSEIINEIEAKTNGRWKPSPGSIYPLLSWLQDNGHVKELPTDQSGMKRYEPTDSGRVLLSEQKKIFEEQKKMMDEQRKIHMRLRKEGRFFGPPFMRAPWFRFPPERTVEIRRTMRKLVTAFLKLGEDLEAHFSKQALDEALKLLNNTAEKLEEISQKLEGGKNE
jgi:DNA-binding PadR family transcriptional regulator